MAGRAYYPGINMYLQYPHKNLSFGVKNCKTDELSQFPVYTVVFLWDREDAKSIKKKKKKSLSKRLRYLLSVYSPAVP